MLGAGQAAAQAELEHAVVDDAAPNVVNILLRGVVSAAAPAAEIPGPPVIPAGKATIDAFKMTGYTVTAVTPADGATAPAGAGTQLGYSIVAVTVNTPITGVPTIVYTKPGQRDGRLQVGGTQDVESFNYVVRPAQPALPQITDIEVEKGATVRHGLPEVTSGGMLPIVYTIEQTANTPLTTNIPGGTAANPLDSGLRFDADARSIVGIARDIGAYTISYRATSADATGTAPTQVRTVKINVVAVAPPPPGLPTDGIITAVTVDGTEERTIDGMVRAHIDEGTLTTVSVTVEWNHQEVTQLWVGHTAARPPDAAKVQIRVVPDTDTGSIAWISPAETSEAPGPGTLGGDDAVLATNVVSIAIPGAPKTNKDDTSRFLTSTGKVSL